MKKNLFYISLIAGVMGLSSCSKLLTEQSQSEVIPKTAQDFRELLMGSGYIGNNEPANFLSMMDDDITFNLEYPGGSFPIIGTDQAKMLLPIYSWQPYYADRNGIGQPQNGEASSTGYATYYQKIMGCNAVLDNIDNAIGTQADKDRVKAEALAIRAHYYFMLVNIYGDPYNASPSSLGVPLKLDASISAEFTVRNTVGEVYDRIVMDLKEASRLLDPQTIVRADFHINQPAIHILLSRVYLHMNRWDDVVTEANKAFEQGARIVDLKTFTAAPLFNYNNPEVEWVFGSSPEGQGSSVYKVSLELRQLFDPKDVRFTLGYSQQPSSASELINKFPRSAGSELVQNIRSAEALLNRAEAQAQLGKVGEAILDLNTLRRSRIKDYVDVAISEKNAAIAAIRLERRLEFCHELFRWFDLRRYGRPEISHRYQAELGQPVVQYVLTQNDPMYTLPFPTSLVLRNPKMVQNPAAAMLERNPQ